MIGTPHSLLYYIDLTQAVASPVRGMDSLATSSRAVVAEVKYEEAVGMYATTQLPLVKIAKKCGVSPAALGAYIARHHRDIMFERYGIEADSCELRAVKVRPVRGQTATSRQKYCQAIEACADPAYIEMSISEIGRQFGVSGSGLANQLRGHYPEIIAAREAMRARLGICDNLQRGARRSSVATYGEAVKLYSDSHLTLRQVAAECEVPEEGFGQHLRFYHRDLVEDKARRRAEAKAIKPEALAKEKKSPHPQTEAKYAAAIADLRENPRPLARIAASHGLNADVFRVYVKAHYPELAAKRKVVTTLQGTKALACSIEKYGPAVEEYCSSGLSLRAVAARHGLNFKSLSGYINRNCPEARWRHAEAAASPGGDSAPPPNASAVQAAPKHDKKTYEVDRVDVAG